MKRYRILYWFGSIHTVYVLEANNKEEAEKKFREINGKRSIIDIKELS